MPRPAVNRASHTARGLTFGYVLGEADAPSRGYHIHVSAHHDVWSTHERCGGGHVVPDEGYDETREMVTAGFRYGPVPGITPGSTTIHHQVGDGAIAVRLNSAINRTVGPTGGPTTSV